MKRIAGLIVIATLFLIGTGEAKHRQEFSGSVEFFSSSLAPYGEWVNTDFGSAWRPVRVNHHWRPYLYGRWVWTDYGWYWVSDEPFGWATFHYGRWTYDDYYGWIWVPGRDWGPAWVEWRYDDDYIGWAPLSPYAQFSLNVGVIWSNRWVAPVHYWNFIPCGRFTTAGIANYVEPIERSRRIFGGTRTVGGIRSVNDRVINEGIDTRFIERRANVRISRVDVVDRKDASTERFVRDDRQARIEAYRPNIQNLPRGNRNADQDRPAVMPRRGETARPMPRVDNPSNMGERNRDRVQSQKDAFYERREQSRQLQQEEQARSQERRMENQRPQGNQERRMENQRPQGNQERRMENQRPQGNQERRMQEQQRPANPERRVQEQPRSRGQERQSVERGVQQGGRERGNGRPNEQQGGNRGRGRRPG